jgi:hypothetical protein
MAVSLHEMSMFVSCASPKQQLVTRTYTVTSHLFAISSFARLHHSSVALSPFSSSSKLLLTSYAPFLIADPRTVCRATVMISSWALSNHPLSINARQELLKTLTEPELVPETKSCFGQNMPKARLLPVASLMLDLKADRAVTTGYGNEGDISENGESKAKAEVIDLSVEEEVGEMSPSPRLRQEKIDLGLGEIWLRIEILQGRV